MESLINNCFILKGDSVELNRSGTRRLNVIVDSVYPTVKITIRLTAVDHNCHIEMSPQTLCEVMKHASTAILAMSRNRETKIFENEFINVFTEEMHNKCAVCFVDQRGVRINMMVKTFKSMRENCSKILIESSTIYTEINSIAKKFKPIVDVIFDKIQQHQLNEECTNFVNGIKLEIDKLCNIKAPREHNYIDLEYDSYEEEYNKCYKCGCTCKNGW